MGAGCEDNRNSGLVAEEEITKVLETGAALGFDFNGREEEISQVISIMEREDEERVKS